MHDNSVCDTTSHTSSKKTTAAYMVCPRIVLLLQQRCLWEEGPTHVSVDVGMCLKDKDTLHSKHHVKDYGYNQGKEYVKKDRWCTLFTSLLATKEPKR